MKSQRWFTVVHSVRLIASDDGRGSAAGELLTLEQEGFLPNGLGRPGIAPGGPVKGTPGRAAVRVFCGCRVGKLVYEWPERKVGCACRS